jgi:hypothetical protein
MPDLVPVHGGLAEPVSCTVSGAEQAALVDAATSLPKIPVSDADLSTVYRFGDGGLSPLTGPMNEATWKRVLTDGRDRARRQALGLDHPARAAGHVGARHEARARARRPRS